MVTEAHGPSVLILNLHNWSFVTANGNDAMFSDEQIAI